MTSMVQKNQIDEEEKIEMQNSDNLMLQNNDSNRNSTGQYKNLSSYRKTSKRREAQEEKAVVLELFKDLIKVVNQKFQNAYLSPPKPKMPAKIPKITKNSSVKPSRKQETLKKKQESISVTINNNRVEQKSQSRQLSQPAFQSIAPVINHPPTPSNHPSPQPFQTFSTGPHVSHTARKSSEHASHREKSQSEKPNVLNVLKEALKKEILENYFMEMKYIIHEDIEEEVEEVKSGQNGLKMVEEQNENHVRKVHKNSKNFVSSQNLDDLEVLSNEQECLGKFLESIKNIPEEEKNLINEESQKLEQGEKFESSSSSSEQNQKYPPHSHMPEGHASTTQQFLQQHNPIPATLPHSSQALITQQKPTNLQNAQNQHQPNT